MTQSRVVRVLTAAAAAFALFALTGCAEKVTTPDAGFSTLEGVATDQMVLVGYQQPALSEAHWLQGTNSGDEPFFSYSLPMSPDSTGKLFGAVFDHTVADGLQLYRNQDGAGLVPVYDYSLRPFMKDLPNLRDIFLFQDPNAAGVDVRWTVRGSLSGRVSHESPVSNEARASGAFDQTMVEASAHRFRDSLGTFSWAPEPRAAFYVVDVMDYQEISANRSSAAKCQLPSPIYPDPTVSQTVVVTDSTNVKFDLRGQRFPKRFLVRVSAFDSNFHLVNRLNPGANNLNTQRPIIGPFEHYKFVFTEEGPANFNAFFVLPMGGVKVVFDPFDQDVGTRPAGDQLRSQPVASGRTPRHGVVTKGLTGAQVRALVERRAGKVAAR